MIKKSVFILLFVATNAISATPFTDEELNVLWQRIFSNLTHSGRVIASPSTHHPDYAYHWVRDAALTMALIEQRYADKHENEIEIMLKRYIDSEIQHQNAKSLSPTQDILGEPKFYLNGEVYEKPWGRPQNDGPALRAITIMQFANHLPKTAKNQSYIESKIYGGGLNPKTMGVVKKDLEYTAHHHQDENFDLWEEVYGHHFFTKMVQRKALILGSNFAKQLNDHQAADYYLKQVQIIEHDIDQFFDKQRKQILAHLPGHSGPQKTQELDMSIFLGVIHGQVNTNDKFNMQHPYLQSTLNALTDYFKTEYAVNQGAATATLYGRYPNDTYDGYETDSLANPWLILTATAAEYYYVTDKTAVGDALLARLKQLAPTLHFHEQLNRNNATGQGAYDLTWSYAAVLHALGKRKDIT